MKGNYSKKLFVLKIKYKQRMQISLVNLQKK